MYDMSLYACERAVATFSIYILIVYPRSLGVSSKYAFLLFFS